jgi:2,4-dienoyl-CoA reductase-like NADH-dependent reductase (Old Yellow Enzyme family)/thioredoxin reductase
LKDEISLDYDTTVSSSTQSDKVLKSSIKKGGSKERMSKPKHLSKPIKIGSMEVKNRMVMAPTATNLASPDCGMSKPLIAYYTARARGGVGLIIVEDTTISETGKYGWRTLGLFDDRLIPSWQKLTKSVHAYGAKVAPQLMHPSFNSRSSLSGVQPVAASPIASRLYKELPRELTIKEIKQLVEQFGEAARRAKQAGCDAVELHCAHNHHLLGSFLSPLHNKRTDEYGGSIEARLKITLEVIQNIHSNAGPDFPILVRISGSEFSPGGLTIEHSQYVAKLLEEAGVNAIHVSGGTSDQFWVLSPPVGCPIAANAPQAEMIKKVVNIPVLVVGGINTPWEAESLLATGKADMVVMARALIADPEFPNKALAGKYEDITPCVRDMACIMEFIFDRKITCMMNPLVGNEAEIIVAKAKTPKRVLVVGGGPGGMEAAQVAASRGHQVTLMEKGSKLGGQLLMAAFAPMKQEFTLAVKYLANQLKKTGVKVELNREVTPKVVDEFKPDAVVIATGGLPIVPSDLAGTKRKSVVTAWDVLSGRVQVLGEVLVIGGGLVGCETADFIAHPVNDMMPGAKRVTIMELMDYIVRDELGPQRTVLIRRLLEKGVRIITKAECLEVLEDGVRYCIDGKGATLRGFNTIVLALGTTPNNKLSEKLKNRPFPVYVIGDAKEPRKSREAIAEGWEIGRSI